MNLQLIQKYNTSGPRYTSYPTVPFWEPEKFKIKEWKQSVHDAFWASGKEISLYLHLPFCESLCTYCGCTTYITKNHSWEEIYLKALIKEWEMYLDILPTRPILKELHLGGGTPTFFSHKNLEFLISSLTKKCEIGKETEFGFECHPSHVTFNHLQTLRSFGFNRISIGIQDFDPTVQSAINRKQSYEDVFIATNSAKNLGFNSVNFDLVYGLPKQSISTVQETIRKTIDLKPNRIAFYGYAHVPWLKKSQKKLEPFLPSTEERMEMYTNGKELLCEAGYIDVGMDHFALPEDSLLVSSKEGTLHRNFMGYTTQSTALLLGLGMSAIGDSWTSFAQNTKSLKEYLQLVDEGSLPIFRGHHLTHEDLIFRKHILNLMCKYETEWTESEFHHFGLSLNFELLDELKNDELIIFDEHHIEITEKGKPFVRNICMAFDARLSERNSEKEIFSKTL
ncbi:MAG: oxygen-independent coproporphyrinogen III oxidase [Bacteroidota bacterium]